MISPFRFGIQNVLESSKRDFHYLYSSCDSRTQIQHFLPQYSIEVARDVSSDAYSECQKRMGTA